MSEKMRILITGGAGFIGSNIVKILEDKGIETIVLDDFSQASYKNLLDIKGDIICGDICDDAVFDKLPRIDGVIHEAAITDTTLEDDRKMMMVNFNGFKNILNFCIDKNIKLVYASSAGVYGSALTVMSENQKPVPHNTYAYSKYLCDCLTNKIIKEKKLPSIVGLRYFNVYGPNEYHKGASASMIYQLYLQMKEGKRPRIFKYGEQKRDFIYVKDVARVTIEALESAKSGIFNLGTGQPRTFNDIIAALNDTLGKKLKPDYFDNPYKDKYQDFTQADTSLLQEKLDTKTEYSLEAGISDYIKNHLV